MDGVALLGADLSLVSGVVVAGEELVPEPALQGVVHDDAEVEGANFVEGGRGREERRLGVGSEDDGLGAAAAR